MKRRFLLTASSALLLPLAAHAHPGHVHAEEWGIVIGLLVAAAMVLGRAATRLFQKRP